MYQREGHARHSRKSVPVSYEDSGCPSTQIDVKLASKCDLLRASCALPQREVVFFAYQTHGFG
jgi:hypothetical protein